MLENPSHTGWYLHDAYWLGACMFIVHFIWLRLPLLRHKNVILRLILMTAFWPLTYTISIFYILRMRMLKLKNTKY
jgi:hypothetical protein